MHVTAIGAGALGRIYGVRLASAGTDVAFVVRPSRLAERDPFVIEQQNASRRRDVLASPVRVAHVPRDTDAILVTVRFDQLLPSGGGRELVEELRGATAPIVVLTPLLPKAQAALEDALGKPVVPAMPGVAGHVDDHGLVPYWASSLQPTRLDGGVGDARERDAVRSLARRLDTAGLATTVDEGVAPTNAATTIAFFPLIASVTPGGGLEGVLARQDLLDTTIAALRETGALARRVGTPAVFARLGARFISPALLRAAVALARAVDPELLRFFDAHFGPKLRDQHLAMGEGILALAREHGVETPALERLMGFVREAG